MILIAHRGNITGPNPKEENKPEYLKLALNSGFGVELDAWYKDGKWFLGHDNPQYEIDFSFFTTENMWIHCKNYAALREFAKTEINYNFFYHTGEDYVLTNRGFIWAWPGKIGEDKTICVMPEYYNTTVEGFIGICSDYIGKYKYD